MDRYWSQNTQRWRDGGKRGCGGNGEIERERDGDCLQVKGRKKGETDAKTDGGRELFKERWEERKKGRLEG